MTWRNQQKCNIRKWRWMLFVHDWTMQSETDGPPE